MVLEIDFFENSVELSVGLGDGAVVEYIVVGGGDGATFFEVFDFAVVAFTNFLRVKGAFGADGDASIAQWFGSDDGNDGEFTGEFVFEDVIFGPGINAVENDTLLAGSDQVFGFGDGLADDPVSAFCLADLFAKFAFAVWSAFNATFLHFFIDHAAKVDFGCAVFG